MVNEMMMISIFEADLLFECAPVRHCHFPKTAKIGELIANTHIALGIQIQRNEMLR